MDDVRWVREKGNQLPGQCNFWFWSYSQASSLHGTKLLGCVRNDDCGEQLKTKKVSARC